MRHGAWIGPLGTLQELPYITSQQVANPVASSERVTLGGVRKRQMGRGRGRSWSVEASALTPAEGGVIQSLVDGMFGPPPWHWVDPWMARTNLLTPAQAACAPGSYLGGGAVDGGVVVMADGASGRSILVNDPNANLFLNRHRGDADYVPVAQGQPVTASAYLYHPTLSPRLRLRWVARDLQPITDTGVAIPPGGARPSRAVVTGMPPEFAVACYLVVDRSYRVALPAITWTDTATPWHPGQGAPRVVMTDFEQTPRQLLDYADVSFTLTEVG